MTTFTSFTMDRGIFLLLLEQSTKREGTTMPPPPPPPSSKLRHQPYPASNCSSRVSCNLLGWNNLHRSLRRRTNKTLTPPREKDGFCRNLSYPPLTNSCSSSNSQPSNELLRKDVRTITLLQQNGHHSSSSQRVLPLPPHLINPST